MRIPRMLALAVFAPTLAVASASQDDGGVEKETQLRGRWRLIKLVQQNQTLDISDAEEEMTWEFKAGTLCVKITGGSCDARVRFAPQSGGVPFPRRAWERGMPGLEHGGKACQRN